MGTTRMTATRNGAAGLLYAGRQGKPHVSDKQGIINQRVLGSTGVNIDPDYAQQQMGAVWRHHDTKKRQARELYRSTWSWSNEVLDPRNPDDVDKALMMGTEVAKRMWPGYQTAIYAQADGEGHKLHLHLETNAINPVTGRALRAEQTSQKQLAKIADEVELENGFEPLPKLRQAWDKKTHAQIAAVAAGKYSWREDLQQRIQAGLADKRAVDWQTLKPVLAEHGVDVHVRRNKKTGDINGLSYKLNFGDNQRPVRAIRLGEMYQKESVDNGLKQNAAELTAEQLKDVQFGGIAAISELTPRIKRQHESVESEHADVDAKSAIHSIDAGDLGRAREAIEQEQQRQHECERQQAADRESQRLDRLKQQKQRAAKQERDRQERERGNREADGPSLE